MLSIKSVIISLLLLNVSSVVLASEQVDLVVIKKSKSMMQLLQHGKVLKQYRIAMGDSPKGHKLSEGDQRTPEGRYVLDYKKPNSTYYRSIHISYPNDEDRFRARALGVNPGGQIMIHGENPHSELSPEEAQQYNWTNGCIAVTNQQMDEIWKLVDAGTPIEIWP